MVGTFPSEEGFNQDQEFTHMQAIVDKVMRAFTFKHPVSDDEAKLVRQEAADFAAELLENYKSRLARRTPDSKSNSGRRVEPAPPHFREHPRRDR
jgi:hypothetical protein